jgi:hypothetical protein
VHIKNRAKLQHRDVIKRFIIPTSRILSYPLWDYIHHGFQVIYSRLGKEEEVC